MLLYSNTMGHCLNGKGRAGKWEKVNSAEFLKTSTRGPATTHIGFRIPEGQLKVRRLITSTVVDSCSDYAVETRTLRAR